MCTIKLPATALATILTFTVPMIHGETIEIHAQQLAIISPPQNDSSIRHGARLLMKFDFPDSLFGKRILFAELWLPFSLVSLNDTTLRYEVFSISTAWDENNVAWDYPWQNPGGDIDSLSCSSRYFTIGSNDALNLDLTSVVREWLNLGRPNEGFLVTVNFLNLRGLRYNLNPLIPVIRSRLGLRLKFDDGPISY